MYDSSMKILLTGASGFVGRHLAKELTASGHEVISVSRSPKSAGSVSWNGLPGVGTVDAIIHLAGDSIAGRWTKEKKEKILNSRVNTTRALVENLPSLKARVLISASAVGFYGSRGDELLGEDAAPGDDFLAEVCRAWEREVFTAEGRGVRTVVLRFGMVLGGDGGALAKMLPAFRFGLGGRLGSGKQWLSWIHVDDLVRMIAFAAENEKLRGVYNATAPAPVRNREFTTILGGVLERPTVLPVPALALRVLFGEMSSMLLASQRADARKIVSAGFEFQFPDLELAMRNLFG